MVDMEVEGLRESSSGRPVRLRSASVLLAGFSGRAREDVDRHIEELVAEGVPPPDRVPMFWSVPSELLTAADAIEVDSPRTSGEVEPVLVRARDGWYVGVGSDHTDRALEREHLAAGKLACPKVLAPQLWSYDNVAPRWDRLVCRSWARRDNVWDLYQESPLEVLRPAAEILGLALLDQHAVGQEIVLFLGTAPLVTGATVCGDAFSFELSDPVRGDRLAWSYRVERPARVSDADSRRDGGQGFTTNA